MRRLLLRALQHFIVRSGLVLVIVWIDVIPAHWMVLELVPHEQAPQVVMPLEDDAEEVKNLALLKVR